MSKRTKRIFTLHIAMTLKQMGHEILNTEANLNDEKLNVYVFKATNRFFKDLTALSKA